MVDDVFWGCVSQVGEQTFNIGRNAALAAGWPETVPGHDDRPAVRLVAAGGGVRRGTVISGQADVVVAGGVESMSRVPMGSSVGDGSPAARSGRAFMERYDGVAPNQGIGAEMIAERWGSRRKQLDEFSLASHEKAAKAQADGRSTRRSRR